MKQVLIVGVCLLAFCAQVHAEPGLDCSRPPYGASYETYKAFLQSSFESAVADGSSINRVQSDKTANIDLMATWLARQSPGDIRNKVLELGISEQELLTGDTAIVTAKALLLYKAITNPLLRSK